MLTDPRTAEPTGRPSTEGAPGPKRWSRRRIIKLAVPVVVLGLLAPVGYSYASALTGPGTDALSVRSIEWLRDHHFRWLVNDVENWGYPHHQPERGGRAAGGPPVFSFPLPGEGEWSPLGRAVDGNPAMYVTYMRPDDVHTSLVSALVWID